MTVNFKIIGNRIKEIRIKKDISQAELAERIDVSVPYISYIETAKKRVSLEALLNIANVLGVTVDELLTGNQKYDATQYQTDIYMLMADCGRLEKKFLFEALQSLKGILREMVCLVEF